MTWIIAGFNSAGFNNARFNHADAISTGIGIRDSTGP
jgi:hypothetical protein